MLPAGAFFYLTTAVSIRTQGFAYPLFVATLWLLAGLVLAAAVLGKLAGCGLAAWWSGLPARAC